MEDYTIQRCSKLYSLNKSLIESEINFSRTVTFSSEIDLTELEKIRSSYPPESKPTYTAFVALAIAKGLAEFPYANRRLYNIWGLPFLSFFQSFKNVDIAVAIERNIERYDAVAYIEILRNVKSKSILEVGQLLRTFAKSDLETSQQWKSFYNLGMFAPLGAAGFIAHLPFYFPRLWTKYRGGAVLISSPAKYGVDGLVAAWTHPLSFSFGLAQKKPMVKNDVVVPMQAFTFVMNWDRRVMAGAQAARLFSRIAEYLRNPDLKAD